MKPPVKSKTKEEYIKEFEKLHKDFMSGKNEFRDEDSVPFRKKKIIKIKTKRRCKECFIQPAIAREEKLGHRGYTHKLLGVPEDYNLSHAETLLEKIVDTPIGEYAKNPLVIGKRKYKVTPDLKRHVNFALNLIRIAQKKGNRKK